VWDLTVDKGDSGYYKAMKMSSMLPVKVDNEKVRLVRHPQSLSFPRLDVPTSFSLSSHVTVQDCSM